MQLKGIHHLTAITANVSGNYRFYTGILGMRLVKKSVNQDDVSAYHMFYADAVGSPGTDLTFFDWNVPHEKRGTSAVIRSYLRVNGEDAFIWWDKKFTEKGAAHSGIQEIDGRLTLYFEDPEGQRLALIDDNGEGDEPVKWDKSPVPPQYQIRGIGPVLLSVPELKSTDVYLEKVLGLNSIRTYNLKGRDAEKVYVYKMNNDGPGAELHVVVQPDIPVSRQGAGGVHHIALRTPDESEYHLWTDRLNSLGIPNSGEIDRHYFRSLYFREPNGILFEIATDGPGFTVDEDFEKLGEEISLPPFLQPKRDEIVAGLKPIE